MMDGAAMKKAEERDAMEGKTQDPLAKSGSGAPGYREEGNEESESSGAKAQFSADSMSELKLRPPKEKTLQDNPKNPSATAAPGAPGVGLKTRHYIGGWVR
jgi:hypothetical protein